MRIENSFTVDASPDAVFGLVLDAEQIVSCVPGAELVELIDSQTFRGKLTVKVGAVQVAYLGTAHILDVVESEVSATVTVTAEGREIGGQGAVRASISLTVAASGGGSTVSIATDFTVTGRIAQFGQGIIADVSRRLVGQMASAMSARLRETRAPEPLDSAS